MGTETLRVGSDGYGGYLTSPVFVAQCDALARGKSTFLSLARWASYRSRTIYLPKLTVGASFAFITEGARKPKTDLAFDRDTLTIKEIAGILVLSERLRDEADVSIESLIRSEIASEAARFIDDNLWQGEIDTNNPNGIDGLLVQASGAGCHSLNMASFDDGLPEAILAAIKAVKTAGYTPSAIACHPIVTNALQLIYDNARNLFGTMPMSIWGVPIVESPNIAIGAADTNGLQSTKIVVADFSTIHTGVMPSSFKVSDSATIVSGETTEHLFQEDKLAVRAVFNIGQPVIRRPTAVAVVDVYV